jgi:hypothetical protein
VADRRGHGCGHRAPHRRSLSAPAAEASRRKAAGKGLESGPSRPRNPRKRRACQI